MDEDAPGTIEEELDELRRRVMDQDEVLCLLLRELARLSRVLHAVRQGRKGVDVYGVCCHYDVNYIIRVTPYTKQGEELRWQTGASDQE